MVFMVAESIVSALQKVVNLPRDGNDSLLFQGKELPIVEENFSVLSSSIIERELFFIDGGQAELLVASNFVLGFVRIVALGFKGKKKTVVDKREAYVLVTSSGLSGSIIYSAKVFAVKGDVSGLVPEVITVDSEDQMFRSGVQRAPIAKLVGMTRHFLELGLARDISIKFPESVTVMDGTLDANYPNEAKLVADLSSNVCALAKSSSLFTSGGGSPTVVLSKICPFKGNPWIYSFSNSLHFVKLHPKSNHIFRFSGLSESAALLLELSSDPIFLGYPYGLILVDRLARISEKEKSRLRAQFLLRKELAGLKEFLATQDAHGILDQMG